MDHGSRLVDLKRDQRLVPRLIFTEQGARAGATLPHSHSAAHREPDRSDCRAGGARRVGGVLPVSGRCIYPSTIQQELATDKRVVIDTPDFLVFCPFASRFPFETWIVRKRSPAVTRM